MERKSPTANTRFRFEQSHINSGRFFYLYYFCVFYCLGYAIVRERFDKRTEQTYFTYHFSIRALSLFNVFYLLFYPNGKKVVPINIGDYLSNIGLAQWIMDDGTFNGGVILQTNAFQIAEVELLISVLKNNFNLNSHIRFERKQPIIYLPSSELPLLKSLVLDHMHLLLIIN